MSDAEIRFVTDHPDYNWERHWVQVPVVGDPINLFADRLALIYVKPTEEHDG